MKNLPLIFSNRRFRWMVIGITIIMLVFLAINVFRIGGDLFVFTLNSSINAPLAIIVTGLGVSIWRLMSKDRSNRVLWSGILIGWALWTLAELIWSVYSYLGREIPYPSLADFFWMIGYIPMGIGLITRSRSMPVKPNRRQSLFIYGLSFGSILVTLFFVLRPTIQGFDPQRIFESILNLVYPLGDLMLLVIVWRLFFTYEEGDFGFGWRMIALGFIFNSVADFIFTYTTWQGIYYPDRQANLISRLGVDVPYTISYLLWFTGVLALSILLRQEDPLEPGTRVRRVRTYGNILLYTRQDDTVLDVSSNFKLLFEASDIKGKSLADALTISEQSGQAILEKLHHAGQLANLSIQVRNCSGEFQEVKVSGVAIFDSRKEYLGANLLLRMRIADSAFDSSLKEESRGMVKYVLEHSGSNTKTEIGQFLADYYLSFIQALLVMTFHQGGSAANQAMLDQLMRTAQKNMWHMRFNLQTVLENSDYPLEVLREALPVLLETAKQFAAQITNPSAVETCLNKVRARFNDTVLHDVAFYGQAGNDVGFADHRKGPYPLR